MLMKWIIIIILIFSINVMAGPQGLDCQSSGLVANLDDISEVAETVNVTANCSAPNVDDIHKFCVNVTLRQNGERENGDEFYFYQDTLKKMACVLPSDSKEISNQKIKSMWDSYGEKITCTESSNGLEDAHVFRHATVMRFNLFFTEMVKIYKVNLNNKDPRDGRTIYQFCIDERNKYNSKDAMYQQTDKICTIIQNGMSNP